MTGQTKPVWILLGCSVIGASVNAYMIAPASIGPPLIADFAIDRTAIGTIISAAVFGSVVAQLPSGVLMDRYDNRRLMLGAVVIFTASSIAVWVVPSYLVLLGTRILAGTMLGLMFTMSANIIGRVFPAARRGFATSVFVASAPAGFAVAQVTSPLLATRVGWEVVFTLWPLVTIIGYGLFRVATPEPVRTGERLTVSEFLTAIRNPSVLLVAASAFCAYGVYFFLNSWMPTYATEVLAISLAGAGAVTSLVPFVGIIARPGGGWISDSLGDRRLVIAGSLLAVLPVLFVLIQVRSPTVFGGLLLLAGVAAQLSAGIYYAYTQELAPDAATGTSLTVFTTLAFSGSLVSPVLGGWLIDSFSWRFTFSVYIGMAFVGAVAIYLVRWTESPGRAH